jgi:hypothetical protein
MDEVASTPKLVDQAVDATGGLTATVPRSQIESALHDDAGADLFLEIARIQNGERDDRTVKIAWERKDLEDLLGRASGDPVTLTFNQEELERMLDDDVEAHGLREKALVLTIAAATAAGFAGSASAQVMSDGGGGGTPSAVVSTGGDDGFSMPSPAVDAALAGGIALLITGAAFVARTTRRRDQPA